MSLKGSLLIRCVLSTGFSGEGARYPGLLPQPPCWCPNRCWGRGDTFWGGRAGTRKASRPRQLGLRASDLTFWCRCRSTHLSVFSPNTGASDVTEVVGYIPLPGRIPEKSCVLPHVGFRQREMKCSPRSAADGRDPCWRRWTMLRWGIQAPPGPMEPCRSVWGC